MNATVLRRLLVAGAVGTGFLSVPGESHAIFHWFARCCQPAVPCAPPVQVAQYVPTVAYRQQCVNVPVTTYRPITSCGPCGATQVSYQPVTTYRPQVQLIPYTTYRIVYSPVVAAPVANYAVPAAPSCCAARPVAAVAAAPVMAAAPVAQASCCGGAGGAATTYYRAPGPTTAYYGSAPTGYNAYAAPGYSAGYGPPGAGLPVDSSAGNQLQSGFTGSSLQGVSPTLSPGSTFSNGTQLSAPTVPMPAQPQMAPGQTIHAPAAGMTNGQAGSPGHVTPTIPPSQSQQVPYNGPPQTYAEPPATNGGATHPATPNGAAPNPVPNGSEGPIQPIPREESNQPSADPASGPAIVPPASRTTNNPGERARTYSRVTYLPGDLASKPIATAAVAADPRPAVSSDGWRASSR